MATLTPKTISELTAATSLGNDYLVPVSDPNSVTSPSKKVTGRALLDSWYKQGTALVAGDDLDNFKTAGSFYSSISTTSAAILHTPTTTQGYRLDVIVTSSAAYPTQMAVCYNGDIYRRSMISINNTPTWKAWTKMLSDEDVVAISGGGTGATTASAALSALGGAPKVGMLGMTANAMANLLAALNYGTNTADLPVGVSLVNVGNNTGDNPNQNRVLLVCFKLSNTVGAAFTVSPYTALNGKSLNLSSNGWAEVTS